MAGAGSVRAGQAYIEISEDHSKLEAGLKKIARTMQTASDTMRSAGTKLFGIGDAAIAGLLAATRAFADMGSALKLMSMRTGIAVKDLSALSYVAQRFGVDVNEIELPIRKMQKNIIGAAGDSKEATRAFGLLGVSVGQLMGKTADQQIGILGDQFAKLKDPTEKAAIASEIFGKSGTSLLPILDLGSKGMAQWVAHAKALGGNFMDKDADKDASAALRLKQAMDDIWTAIKNVVASIGGALAPALTKISGGMALFIGKTAAFIRENRGLVIGVAVAAVAVTALGAALIGLGLIVPTIASGLAVIGALIGFVFSPIGLAVLLVAERVYSNWEKIKNLTVSIWKSIKSEVLGALQGIKDAFAGGDLMLAVKIMWTTIELLSVQAASNIWGHLLTSFFTVRNAIEDEWRSMLAAMGIGKVLTAAEKDARAAGQAASIAGLLPTDEIKKLQKQLDDLEKQAKNIKDNTLPIDSPTPGEAGGGFGTRPTAGLFNATAAFGLGGGGGAVDRIAKATEETAKNTSPTRTKAGQQAYDQNQKNKANPPAPGALPPGGHDTPIPSVVKGADTITRDANGNYILQKNGVRAVLTPEQYENLRSGVGEGQRPDSTHMSAAERAKQKSKFPPSHSAGTAPHRKTIAEQDAENMWHWATLMDPKWAARQKNPYNNDWDSKLDKGRLAHWAQLMDPKWAARQQNPYTNDWDSKLDKGRLRHWAQLMDPKWAAAHDEVAPEDAGVKAEVQKSNAFLQQLVNKKGGVFE